MDQDFVALQWVTGEIEQTSEQFGKALLGYADDVSDQTRLRLALTHAHQIHATLRLLDIASAVQLAREVEEGVQAMLHGRIPGSESNLQVLLAAGLQLPGYLRRIASQRQESPLDVLSLVNELRVLRGAEPLAMPDPVIDTRALERGVDRDATPANEEELQTLRRGRQKFQTELLGLLRGEAVSERLQTLQKLFSMLADCMRPGDHRLWWQACAGVCEAVGAGGVTLDTRVHEALREVDNEFRANLALEQGFYARAPAAAAYDKLLSIIALSSPVSAQLAEIQQRHHLRPDAAGARNATALDDLGATGAAVDAIGAELNVVLERLEASEGDAFTIGRVLREVEPELRRIASVLAGLGYSEEHALLLPQLERIDAGLLSGSALDERLTEISAALLDVDQRLAGRAVAAGKDSTRAESRRPPLASAQVAVCREVQAGIDQIKQAVTDYVSLREASVLEGSDARLHAMGGAMLLLGSNKAAAVLADCEALVVATAGGKRGALLPAEIEVFADALSSVEYFLERLLIDKSPADLVLAGAHESLRQLLSASAEAVVVVTPASALADDFIGKMLLDHAPALSKPEPEPVLPPRHAAAPLVRVEDEEPLDTEIIEIFLEEAGEVLEAIGAQLPAWREAPGPGVPLTELRRAFHTLKGSGRMVGAQVLGELAWSVENLLNRVIERTLPANRETVEAVERAWRLMPSLVEAFASRGAVDRAAVDQLQQAAQALARGEAVAWGVAAGAAEPAEEIASVEATPEPEREPEVVLELEPEFEVQTVPEPQPEPQPEYAAAPVVRVEDEEPLDAEIIEIFLEEAGEVLEAIGAQLPAWREAPGPGVPLTELRRAFHTLKGSGRMVGAQVLGELAWSVENLLNRVIERTLPANRETVEAVERAWRLMPSLVEAFASRGAVDRTPVDQLQQAAQALARGEAVDWGVAAGAAEPAAEIATPPPETAAIESAVPESEAVAEPVEESATPEPEIIWPVVEPVAQAAGEVAVPAPEPGITAPDAGPVEHIAAPAFEIEITGAEAEPAVESAMEAAPLAEESAAPDAEAAAEPQREPVIEVPPVAEVEVEPAPAERPETEPFAPAHVPELVELEDWLPELEAAELAVAAEAFDDSGAGSADRLLEIFIDETRGHVEALRAYLAEVSDGTITQTLMRTLHTLRGSARVAGEDLIGDVLEPLEEFVSEAGLGGRLLAPPEIALLQRVCAFLVHMLDARMQGHAPLDSEAAALAEECRGLLAQPLAVPLAGAPAMSDARLARFLEESLEKLFHATTLLDAWSSARDEEASRAGLCDELLAIHQRATQLEVNGVLDLSGPLLEALAPAAQGREAPSAELFGLIKETLEAFLDVMDRLAAGQLPEAPAAIIERLRAYAAARAELPVAPAPAASAAAQSDDAGLELLRVRVGRDLLQAETELLDIFIEEADELMVSIDESIDAWRHGRDDRGPFDNLQRYLHTLKGGARMAGLKYLGELSHNFETFLINENLHFGGFGDNFFERVAEFHEQLLRTMDMVKERPVLPVESVAIEDPEHAPVELPEPAREVPPAEPEASVSALEPLPPATAPAVAPPPERATAMAAIAAARQPAITSSPAAKPRDEVVRVSAQLLEDLVNLAGETSISRGRVEEQVSELGHLFEDMQGTIERLQNQVRRLDIATEAQVLFRRERAEGAGLDGFDPLEMDRYSQLQQLSRSLVESASDLLDIKRSLAEKTRDLETVLIQQSRINSQLQEGLMRSRMVPFASILPRLKRVVRQVAGELGKRVELELGNLSGELDRGILERVVAPLEHMLRNAVDHGIEARELRIAAGKDETGLIQIDIAREGGDVLIAVADDGAGVNLEGVRAKAIERGLMGATSHLGDHEVLQFILHSGFSTASHVTQISGRGVGMDVVSSEIRQMGGSLEIQTKPGAGTRFLIRLPFTVSVSRALMVAVGSDVYALPLNTVEGVARMRVDELERYSGPDASPFHYAGQSYQVRYLGSLLHPGEQMDLANLGATIPVVLVRGGGQTLAVALERLVGAREIVVKSLGPQFGAVPGLSGATVLGDGSVVLILDIPAMLRADVARGVFAEAETSQIAPQEKTARTPLIMVVDDSVTVRKVTTRILEREGMRVVSAKDGADAMTKLLDEVPDLMLLDIEMPHMDGFEVLSKVRLSEQLRHLPIIMITSRTGEKHRERALALGADLYLGKPYQESVLMEHITTILGRST
ncbi:MAG: Hpt domain-containing protein [Gammaproteobacteria bacterium]|nr:Hpt domain-containing protein [Gammaproteobacteria bacterium]